MMNESEYCDHKAELIRHANLGNVTMDGIKQLVFFAPEFAKNDSDVEWLKVCIITKNFTKVLSLKKAEIIMMSVRSMQPIGSASFSESCKQKAIAYLERCRMRTKKNKRVNIGICISCVVLVALLAVVGWYCDMKGLFYGTQSITFSADGREYTQNDVVRYNSYAQLSIPKKKGYDATCIVDVVTNEKLFDASGKALTTVSNRDLSDYEGCDLKVIYEPHVYSAELMSAKNATLASVTFTVEDDPGEVLDDPQHLDGYVFDGWYTDSRYKKPFTGNFMDYADMEEPLVLYPHYSLDGWTLTWNLDGGIFEKDVQNEYTILTDLPLPDESVVKKTGYTLKGWALDGKPIGYFTPTIMRDATLTALWEAIEYRISYELNGGTLTDAESYYTIENTFSLPQLIRNGYLFDGWYTNNDLTKPVSSIGLGSIGDRSFYAKWTPITYSITYNLNGGENSSLNPTVYTAEKDVLLHNPQRIGYTFKGWYFDSTHVLELNAALYGNVNLVANWEVNEYKIMINPNNGEDVYTQTVRYGGYYALAQPNFRGHTFIAYYLAGEPIDITGNYYFTCDISIVAKYTANEYNISYVSEGQTVSIQQVTYGQAYSLFNPAPKKNYEFVGWYDKEVGGNRISDGVYSVDKNTAYYAAWIKILIINLESDNDYAIDNTIEKAYIVGNYNGNNNLMTGISVKIAKRDYDLIIELVNAGFKAKNNTVAISCENSSFTLKIVNNGISHIEGGNGSNGANGASGSQMTIDNRNGTNGENGQHALDCGRVIFEEKPNSNSKLTLKAGNGGKGGDGGIDKDRSRMWLNYVPNGGNGGDSLSALYCKSYSINGTIVNFEKGSAGAKGNAGSRGDWWKSACWGTNGNDGKQNDAIRYK